MKIFASRKMLLFTAALVCCMMFATVISFAATVDLVKDGKMVSGGFVNAGEEIDGAVQGPGNWTQINCGDAEATLPYLHIIVKATGDTANAQIAVSDTFTFNLKDLGITLTDEYQDVVLPIEEKGIAMISWVNFMGLDGGSSVYTVKDIFLSDSAEPTIKAAAPAPATEAPKTGSSDVMAVMMLVIMAGSALAVISFRKKARSS
ncbi:MAG: hypothetical protein GX187_01220 [Clostridiaceae bacterium]|nr:hypothetical protein [Clostridiaceae bacterium]